MSFCPEWLRGPFPYRMLRYRATPVRLRRKGGRTKIVPCHEVADGFDFPASHRKIKKTIRSTSANSAASKERSDWA
jgi:hypothetical protein